MRTASLRPVTFLLQICTKLRNHFNAFMEVLYCFTVVIGLSGDASDYNRVFLRKMLGTRYGSVGTRFL